MAKIGIVTYTVLFYCLIPFALLKLLYRGLRAPDYFKRWPERFGFFSHKVTQPSIWIHAVSVGELQAAIPIINTLQAKHPNMPIVVTSTTPTGLARAQAVFADRIITGHIPYDLPGALRRFLNRTQPKIAIIMETELWPNLFEQCAQRKIPIAVVNARLSERSARGYQRFTTLTQFILQRISWLAAQNEADGQRFLQLGLAPERLAITGNVKFDQPVQTSAVQQGKRLKATLGSRPVWIAASTHEGEDEQVLASFSELKKHHSDLLLILVPRHPERFNSIADLCTRQHWKIVRRSLKQEVTNNTDVLLGDTMGEMMTLFAASDVVYMGGSLVPTGGHNMIEPAALGLPIITGPHTFNFAQITQQLIALKAAQEIKNVNELTHAVRYYLQNLQQRQTAGAAGLQWLQENKGATARVVQHLSTLIAS
ncbi:3-deoxy-D-manno-octulosonic acid transferase [hydrothermal vent metagenome]|uniref:lipid IVA 3-deoxy-D-manno-octulosonic acid transferase n=1 Tax=hydrothermal vent metagenome TaxID=652676 RepID=A0A3B0Z9Z9_9ZZZZ